MTKPDNNTTSERLGKYLLSTEKANANKRTTTEIDIALNQVPLTLQPFFKDDSDLNKELVQRFPTMPLMSIVRFRDIYNNGERGVATLASSDGSATLIVDVTSKTSQIQFAFTFGSMLSLRFHLNELSDLDRRAWLDNMENRSDDIVFLWGQSRWAKDYVICVPSNYYISLLAFSARNFEAAVRLTPQVTGDLFQWLHDFWYPQDATMPTHPADGNSSSDSTSSPNILSEW